jgi:hypothetical protein
MLAPLENVGPNPLAIVKLALIQKQDCSELASDNCLDEEC